MPNPMPDHEPTLTRLQAIGDPGARLAEAGETAEAARLQVEELRHTRNVALAVLHLHRTAEGWKSKAKCYRLAGMDRWTFDDAIGDLPATIRANPDTVNWDAIRARGSLDDLQLIYLRLQDLTTGEVENIAASTAAEYWKQNEIWKTAGRVRDQVALELMNGEHGPPWSNADVARHGRVKSSYASDVRTGKKHVRTGEKRVA